MNNFTLELNHSLNLYLVHCGFYDSRVCNGLYESHVNYFLIAKSFDDAKSNIKMHPEFQEKRMHIDGLQEVRAVGGYQLNYTLDPELSGRDIIINFKHRDLAAAPSSQNGVHNG